MATKKTEAAPQAEPSEKREATEADERNEAADVVATVKVKFRDKITGSYLYPGARVVIPEARANEINAAGGLLEIERTL